VNDLAEILGEISIAILALAAIASWIVAEATEPSEEEVQYWRDVKQQGKDFLEAIDGTWELEDISKLPDVTRNSLIEQLGYDVDKIDDFVVWVEHDPEILKVTPVVVDEWFLGYKQIRRSIRGEDWLSGWRTQ